MNRIVAAAVAASLVAGCSSGRPIARDRIDRALSIAPGEGQPSKIVAAEVAMEQRARERGQWSSFAQYAAPDAKIHLTSGPAPAAAWLRGRRDPAQTASWEPRNVWISCDGSLAVSKGRYRAADGKVGDFVRIWQRSGENEYSWVHHLAALDNPQPARRPALPAAEGDEIVVTAIDSIKGFVADCPERGTAIPAAPPAAMPSDVPSDNTSAVISSRAASRDGTLAWRWEHDSASNRRIVAEYFSGGKWQIALDERFIPDTGAALQDD
ncbi:hypothetical protein [Pontixanthobacter sp.]|uniref:hypothetical protein n=1 Tax=Pontixanthobacter sp. TaxID=2792078 RepID=UPI003C7E7DAD